jgi:hypothetical protein
MRFFTYFVKSLNVLNLLLIAAVASLAVYLLFPLLNSNVNYRPPAVPKQTSTSQEQAPSASQVSSASDYIVVAEQNVFHPERKIPPENKDDKPLAKPEIFLYGTLLTDNMRIAYIEDRKSPQTTPGRGNRQTVVKQGDVVSGFTLKSVEPDRIVLVRGEEQMVVYLQDAKKTRSTVMPTQQPGMQPGGRPSSSPMPGGPQPGPMPTPPGASAPSPMQAVPQPAPGSAAGSQATRQPSRPARTNPTQSAPQPSQ